MEQTPGGSPLRTDSGRQRQEPGAETDEPEPNWPKVEVFTPGGRFVASRRCMNGWLMNKPLVLDKHKRSRPRRSMKGQKKLTKKRARENARGLSGPLVG
jgi:hypothetical protein